MTAPTIDVYFRKKNNLEETISRMVAKDGLTFRVFTTSVDLRRCLIADGFTDLPTAPNTIKRIVMNYSKATREKMKKEIQEELSKGIRFCVTFDEWTSSRNRRFLNLILHGKDSKIWNLGLVRVNGTMSSEKCLDLVEKRLELFNVSLRTNIVSVMTDGTSVMTKIGKISPTSQQLCFAHGIQLAVIDVLYKKKSKEQAELSIGQFSDIEDDENGEDEDEDGDNIDEEDEDEEESNHFQIEYDGDENDIDVQESFKPIIEKIRKTVRMFRRSPLKNEVLQAYVKADYSSDFKELSLILDSKTRWNSLANMLARFYKLRNCIQKALLDLKPSIKPRKYSALSLNEEELNTISDISDALLPLQVAVEALCRRDANLITADTVFLFTLQKLKELKSELSLKLYDALCKRIKERRNDLSGVLQHLHSGSSIAIDNQDLQHLFTTPSKKKIETVIVQIIKRCHPEDVSQSTVEDGSDAEEEDGVEHETSVSRKGRSKKRKLTALHVELDSAIKKALSSTISSPSRPQNLLKTIRQELNLFENGGNRGLFLTKVYECLLGIKPTSIESERAFSSAGYICSKIRSRMNDNTLDHLCSLRAFFQTKDED